MMDRLLTAKVGKKVAALLGVASIAVLTGCQCLEPAGQPSSKAQPQKTIGDGCPQVVTQGGQTIVSQAFPSGSEQSSLVLLESTSPTEVMLGSEFDYSIDVTNLTDCPLYDVQVQDTLPEQYELEASDPQAEVRGNNATWNLGTLGARETKTITARLMAGEAGELEHCATVDYDLRMCQSTLVVSPDLQISKTLPESAILCDTIPMTIEVSNAGTGTVRDITVTDELPDGLTTLEGESTVSFVIPSLSADQTETREINLQADKTGTLSNKATAESTEGLTAEATAEVDVRQAVLTIDKSATDTQFVGRMVEYTIEVGNTGDATANDVQVVDALPAGVEFREANSGGAYNDNTNRIVWSVDSIDPDETVTLKSTVRAVGHGAQRNQAEVTASCADAASASATTEVTGVPAVLLEVVDVEDPIEVGETVTYKVVVTNQGSAPDTDIRISCELEDSQSYVSSDGATPATETGQRIVFEPLAELGTKEEAVWYVRVKAEEVADVRFSAEMKTNQLGDRPVNETEATNQY